ncbi:hypothetical protein [Sphingobacterium sp. WOUb80]|uniref:hypothetical protein n=1 Tax=Sphingobacterium sp. WOUb80 TaxID=3234028 RepID=UPI003CECA22D
MEMKQRQLHRLRPPRKVDTDKRKQHIDQAAHKKEQRQREQEIQASAQQLLQARSIPEQQDQPKDHIAIQGIQSCCCEDLQRRNSPTVPQLVGRPDDEEHENENKKIRTA